eukprot:32670-Pyramimonas_sp.AAC.1
MTGNHTHSTHEWKPRRSCERVVLVIGVAADGSTLGIGPLLSLDGRETVKFSNRRFVGHAKIELSASISTPL